uniref:Uncharacterized protein n=1 Tax=Nelumbo nucifera TaxID=4432 RepID=A0A822ZDJ2_NELNU|nr:TPA_asm: hypothetical protein HUJ06_015818 [Nelumbo nucifera]
MRQLSDLECRAPDRSRDLEEYIPCVAVTHRSHRVARNSGINSSNFRVWGHQICSTTVRDTPVKEGECAPREALSVVIVGILTVRTSIRARDGDAGKSASVGRGQPEQALLI